jgi:hypothetical protein
VLARAPTFGAALRYTAVSLAHQGQTDEARRLVSRIRTLDPGFSRDWVSKNRMAVASDAAKQILLSGLEAAGA